MRTDVSKPSTAHGASHRPAFSLVEIVAVVTIMGIMFMIAQPRLRGFVQRDRVQRAARRVATDLRLSQSEAIRQRAQTSVVFRPSSNAYVVWIADIAGDPTEWVPLGDNAVAMGSSSGAIVMLADDPDYRVAIESADFNGEARITFNEYGVPTEPAGGSIVLGAGTNRITITVNGATGRVTIQDLTEADSPADFEGIPIVDIDELDPDGEGDAQGAPQGGEGDGPDGGFDPPQID